MPKIVFTLALISLVSWSGCSKEEREPINKSLLEKDYDFVMGLAVPDSVREFPTEVFVGRLIAKIPDRVVWGNIQDTFLMTQVWRVQNTYLAGMEYHDDATVIIKSENQSIALTWVGNGTYRDANNELHIEPLKKYTLEVRRGNRFYSDETTVPGSMTFTSVAKQDTYDVFVKKEHSSNPSCWGYHPVQWTPSAGAMFYRSRVFYDWPRMGRPSLDASFRAYDAKAIAIVEECSNRTYINTRWTALAFDSTLAIIYQREGLAADQDMFDFLDYWDGYHLKYRSNLNAHGAKDVVGNFGAYNAVSTEFTLRARRDSCVCD